MQRFAARALKFYSMFVRYSASSRRVCCLIPSPTDAFTRQHFGEVPKRYAALQPLQTRAKVCFGNAMCAALGSQSQPLESSASCVWFSDHHLHAEP